MNLASSMTLAPATPTGGYVSTTMISTHMTPAITKLAICFQLIITATLVDWLIHYFNPEANFGNFLAAIAGSFVLRLLLSDKLNFRQHISGWLVGSITSILMASSVYENWLPGMKQFAVFGMVGFLADLLLQILVYLITYTRDHPSEAFDTGMEKAERAVSFWVKVKADVMEFFNNKKS